MDPQLLGIDQYDYSLPPSQIPDQALSDRSASRLLRYERGTVSDHQFCDLADLLRSGDSLFLNNTRVIPARLLMAKPTGGIIELFCLEPHSSDYVRALEARTGSSWVCMVGGAKKWKSGLLTTEVFGTRTTLSAERLDTLGDGRFTIRFAWDDPNLSFGEVLERAGRIPIPPYFNREPEEDDRERYQTVFAQWSGSVAAPTAGLHFTPALLDRLRERGISLSHLTLHVGAGTFRPVTSKNLGGHPMHGEWFEVSRETIERLSVPAEGRRIAVGTTSMRTLESLYWLGSAIDDTSIQGELRVGQWDYLGNTTTLLPEEAIGRLLKWMVNKELDTLRVNTSLMIAPGYVFRICNGLITNFHLPKSTLLVLVAALIGEDWKKVYSHALDRNYRFLSYGDSSLLLPPDGEH